LLAQRNTDHHQQHDVRRQERFHGLVSKVRLERPDAPARETAHRARLHDYLTISWTKYYSSIKAENESTTAWLGIAHAAKSAWVFFAGKPVSATSRPRPIGKHGQRLEGTVVGPPGRQGQPAVQD